LLSLKHFLISLLQWVIFTGFSFDKGMFYACCDLYGMTRPLQPFVCTVQLARQTWNLRPTKLPHVCESLGIELEHHQALSDAEACARIVLAGFRLGASLLLEH